MGLKNTIFRGSKDDSVNGWGQTIPAEDRYQMRKLISKLNPAHACAHRPTLSTWENPHGRRPDQYSQNCEKVQRGFHQSLGLKIPYCSCWPIPSEGCTRKLYSRLNPAYVCANPQTLIKQAVYMGAGLAKPKLYRVKGFNNLWDSKKHMKRKRRYPVNGQAHNIPLVIDTESEYKKVFLKLNPARIGANHPTPFKQANPHGRRHVTVNGRVLATSGIKKFQFQVKHRETQ